MCMCRVTRVTRPTHKYVRSQARAPVIIRERLVVSLSLDALLSGIVAGYGIAIPVGPIAILILELGLRRGFRIAFCAGAGAASADLIYATVAAVAGTFLVSVLTPYASILRLASGLGLIAIGALLLYHGRNVSDRANKSRFGETSLPQTYGMVLGLTILNPVTVTYFTTLILGMGAESSQTAINAILIRDIVLACILSEANLRPGSLRPLKGSDASGDAGNPA